MLLFQVHQLLQIVQRKRVKGKTNNFSVMVVAFHSIIFVMEIETATMVRMNTIAIDL